MNTRAVMVLCAALVAGVAQAAPSGLYLYRYRDAQGVLHLGTSLPPQAAGYGYEVLDRKSLKVLRVVPPPPTAEQIDAERARAAEQAAEQARAQAQSEADAQAGRERARRDQALLQSYTTVADLERTRDDQLDALASIARGARATVARLEKNLGAMLAQRQEYEREGRVVPAPLQKNIADVEGKLARQRALIESNAKRRDALATRFAADIVRYRELTGQAPEAPPAALGATTESTAEPAAGAAAVPATP